jgi:hypothetical protein
MNASKRAYALPILLFVLSFGYWIGGAVSVYDDLRYGQERARLPLGFGFRMQAIPSVWPEAAQAGAHLGDTLVEFNGRPFTGYHVMRDAVRGALQQYHQGVPQVLGLEALKHCRRSRGSPRSWKHSPVCAVATHACKPKSTRERVLSHFGGGGLI